MVLISVGVVFAKFQTGCVGLHLETGDSSAPTQLIAFYLCAVRFIVGGGSEGIAECHFCKRTSKNSK